MKKKFKDTKIGKLLTSKTGLFIVESFPFVGDLASNILREEKGKGKNKVVSEAGAINWKEPQGIVRGIIVAVLLYLALKGHISWEDADAAKDFINN